MRLLREEGEPHPPSVTSPKLQVREDELPELVEEAARLADERARTLSDGEVRDVLRELAVPEDLAAEAHDRVLEKRAAARKNTQRPPAGCNSLAASWLRVNQIEGSPASA